MLRDLNSDAVFPFDENTTINFKIRAMWHVLNFLHHRHCGGPERLTQVCSADFRNDRLKFSGRLKYDFHWQWRLLFGTILFATAHKKPQRLAVTAGAIGL